MGDLHATNFLHGPKIDPGRLTRRPHGRMLSGTHGLGACARQPVRRIRASGDAGSRSRADPGRARHSGRRVPAALLAAGGLRARSGRTAAPRAHPGRGSRRLPRSRRARRACSTCTARTAARRSSSAIPLERGLRCCYHGWVYDVDGRCLETPGEPAGSRLCERVWQGAYPTHEFCGLVFAYLGPPDRRPAFPALRHLRGAGPHARCPRPSSRCPCNWLQVKDNSMDPVHTAFLHALSSGYQFTDAFGVVPELDWLDHRRGHGLHRDPSRAAISSGCASATSCRRTCTSSRARSRRRPRPRPRAGR